MEPLSREEIKIIFKDAIAPLVTEFKASHDAHEKEIERLTKQSAEHYENFKALEEKLSKQVALCQVSNVSVHEKAGTRMGSTEKDIARIEQKVTEIEKDHRELKDGIADQFKEIKDAKQFNISQWLVVVGVIAMIVLGVIPLIRG